MTYKPPFKINDKIANTTAQIAQKMGQVQSCEALSRSPQLRKKNRIKTIHSSLAIENNVLSIEQVTAVVDGKHVIAPPKDVLEVQNAIKVYNALDSFDFALIDDLLLAHKMLMSGLVHEAGCFRSTNVGVFDDEVLIHAGTPAAYVAEVMHDLFNWLAKTEAHPLIASCVFHYEFEFIHPFADGNGRMGRLWQTVILCKWNPLFAWLPVESLVKNKQKEYYAALAKSDEAADCTEFVVFMLQMIKAALDDVLEAQNSAQNGVGINVGINVGITNEAQAKKEALLALVSENPTITIAQMAQQLGISRRQVERIAARLKESGRLVRVGSKRNGVWKVN